MSQPVQFHVAPHNEKWYLFTAPNSDLFTENSPHTKALEAAGFRRTGKGNMARVIADDIALMSFALPNDVRHALADFGAQQIAAQPAVTPWIDFLADTGVRFAPHIEKGVPIAVVATAPPEVGGSLEYAGFVRSPKGRLFLGRADGTRFDNFYELFERLYDVSAIAASHMGHARNELTSTLWPTTDVFDISKPAPSPSYYTAQVAPTPAPEPEVANEAAVESMPGNKEYAPADNSAPGAVEPPLISTPAIPTAPLQAQDLSIVLPSEAGYYRSFLVNSVTDKEYLLVYSGHALRYAARIIRAEDEVIPTTGIYFDDAGNSTSAKTKVLGQYRDLHAESAKNEWSVILEDLDRTPVLTPVPLLSEVEPATTIDAFIDRSTDFNVVSAVIERAEQVKDQAIQDSPVQFDDSANEFTGTFIGTNVINEQVIRDHMGLGIIRSGSDDIERPDTTAGWTIGNRIRYLHLDPETGAAAVQILLSQAADVSANPEEYAAIAQSLAPAGSILSQRLNRAVDISVGIMNDPKLASTIREAQNAALQIATSDDENGINKAISLWRSACANAAERTRNAASAPEPVVPNAKDIPLPKPGTNTRFSAVYCSPFVDKQYVLAFDGDNLVRFAEYRILEDEEAKHPESSISFTEDGRPDVLTLFNGKGEAYTAKYSDALGHITSIIKDIQTSGVTITPSVFFTSDDTDLSVDAFWTEATSEARLLEAAGLTLVNEEATDMPEPLAPDSTPLDDIPAKPQTPPPIPSAREDATTVASLAETRGLIDRVLAAAQEEDAARRSIARERGEWSYERIDPQLVVEAVIREDVLASGAIDSLPSVLRHLEVSERRGLYPIADDLKYALQANPLPAAEPVDQSPANDVDPIIESVASAEVSARPNGDTSRDIDELRASASEQGLLILPEATIGRVGEPLSAIHAKTQRFLSAIEDAGLRSLVESSLPSVTLVGQADNGADIIHLGDNDLFAVMSDGSREYDTRPLVDITPTADWQGQLVKTRDYGLKLALAKIIDFDDYAAARANGDRTVLAELVEATHEDLSISLNENSIVSSNPDNVPENENDDELVRQDEESSPGELPTAGGATSGRGGESRSAAGRHAGQTPAAIGDAGGSDPDAINASGDGRGGSVDGSNEASLSGGGDGEPANGEREPLASEVEQGAAAIEPAPLPANLPLPFLADVTFADAGSYFERFNSLRSAGQLIESDSVRYKGRVESILLTTMTHSSTGEVFLTSGDALVFGSDESDFPVAINGQQEYSCVVASGELANVIFSDEGAASVSPLTDLNLGPRNIFTHALVKRRIEYVSRIVEHDPDVAAKLTERYPTRESLIQTLYDRDLEAINRIVGVDLATSVIDHKPQYFSGDTAEARLQRHIATLATCHASEDLTASIYAEPAIEQSNTAGQPEPFFADVTIDNQRDYARRFFEAEAAGELRTGVQVAYGRQTLTPLVAADGEVFLKHYDSVVVGLNVDKNPIVCDINGVMGYATSGAVVNEAVSLAMGRSGLQAGSVNPIEAGSNYAVALPLSSIPLEGRPVSEFFEVTQRAKYVTEVAAENESVRDAIHKHYPTLYSLIVDLNKRATPEIRTKLGIDLAKDLPIDSENLSRPLFSNYGTNMAPLLGDIIIPFAVRQTLMAESPAALIELYSDTEFANAANDAPATEGPDRLDDSTPTEVHPFAIEVASRLGSDDTVTGKLAVRLSRTLDALLHPDTGAKVPRLLPFKDGKGVSVVDVLTNQVVAEDVSASTLDGLSGQLLSATPVSDPDLSTPPSVMREKLREHFFTKATLASVMTPRATDPAYLVGLPAEKGSSHVMPAVTSGDAYTSVGTVLATGPSGAQSFTLNLCLPAMTYKQATDDLPLAPEALDDYPASVTLKHEEFGVFHGYNAKYEAIFLSDEGRRTLITYHGDLTRFHKLDDVELIPHGLDFNIKHLPTYSDFASLPATPELQRVTDRFLLAASRVTSTLPQHGANLTLRDLNNRLSLHRELRVVPISTVALSDNSGRSGVVSQSGDNRYELAVFDYKEASLIRNQTGVRGELQDGGAHILHFDDSGKLLYAIEQVTNSTGMQPEGADTFLAGYTPDIPLSEIADAPLFQPPEQGIRHPEQLQSLIHSIAVLPKHEQGMPIRPLVAAFNDPTSRERAAELAYESILSSQTPRDSKVVLDFTPHERLLDVLSFVSYLRADYELLAGASLLEGESLDALSAARLSMPALPAEFVRDKATLGEVFQGGIPVSVPMQGIVRVALPSAFSEVEAGASPISLAGDYASKVLETYFAARKLLMATDPLDYQPDDLTDAINDTRALLADVTSADNLLPGTNTPAAFAVDAGDYLIRVDAITEAEPEITVFNLSEGQASAYRFLPVPLAPVFRTIASEVAQAQADFASDVRRSVIRQAHNPLILPERYIVSYANEYHRKNVLSALTALSTGFGHADDLIAAYRTATDVGQFPAATNVLAGIPAHILPEVMKQPHVANFWQTPPLDMPPLSLAGVPMGRELHDYFAAALADQTIDEHGATTVLFSTLNGEADDYLLTIDTQQGIITELTAVSHNDNQPEFIFSIRNDHTLLSDYSGIHDIDHLTLRSTDADSVTKAAEGIRRVLQDGLANDTVSLSPGAPKDMSSLVIVDDLEPETLSALRKSGAQAASITDSNPESTPEPDTPFEDARGYLECWVDAVGAPEYVAYQIARHLMIGQRGDVIQLHNGADTVRYAGSVSPLFVTIESDNGDRAVPLVEVFGDNEVSTQLVGHDILLRGQNIAPLPDSLPAVRIAQQLIPDGDALFLAGNAGYPSVAKIHAVMDSIIETHSSISTLVSRYGSSEAALLELSFAAADGRPSRLYNYVEDLAELVDALSDAGFETVQMADGAPLAEDQKLSPSDLQSLITQHLNAQLGAYLLGVEPSTAFTLDDAEYRFTDVVLRMTPQAPVFESLMPGKSAALMMAEGKSPTEAIDDERRAALLDTPASRLWSSDLSEEPAAPTNAVEADDPDTTPAPDSTTPSAADVADAPQAPLDAIPSNDPVSEPVKSGEQNTTPTADEAIADEQPDLFSTSTTPERREKQATSAGAATAPSTERKPRVASTPAPAPAKAQSSGAYTPRTSASQAPVAPDFTVAPGDLVTGGAVSKFDANIKAITTLRDLTMSGKAATPEQQRILTRYSGWGGLPQAFPRPDGSVAPGWESRVEQLQTLLNEQEYKDARRSTMNAHYTSIDVIDAMYDALDRFGVQGKNRFLEPSVGNGLFIGRMPEHLREESRVVGVELDKLTGAMAKATYSNHQTRILDSTGFETYQQPPGSFDVVIGNPPFGSYKLFDAKNPDLTSSIHNFFMLKSMRLLRPGGIQAFVISRYFMDATSDRIRSEIAKEAELVGAVRLPETAFKANAGTEVVTDIIFLQKRPEPLKSAELPKHEHQWVKTQPVGFPKVGSGDVVKKPVNCYFVDNPDMVIGDTVIDTGMYQEGLTVRFDGNLTEALQQRIPQLPSGIFTPENTVLQRQEQGVVQSGALIFDIDPAIPDGQMFLFDGKVFQRTIHPEHEHVAVEVNHRRTTTGAQSLLSSKDKERLLGLIGLRESLDELMSAERNDDAPAVLESLRGRLLEQHEAFVRKYGPINRSTNTRLIRQDLAYVRLAALEKNYQAAIKPGNSRGLPPRDESFERSDIFFNRVVGRKTDKAPCETPADALIASLNEHARIDLDYMSSLLPDSPSNEALTTALKGSIFLNPENDTWEWAPVYLSGNVVKKLQQAEEAARTDERFASNVDYLRKNQPARIPFEDIFAPIGAHWLPDGLVTEFVRDLANNPSLGVTEVFNKSTGTRTVKVASDAALTDWRADSASFDRIMEAAIGNRPIRITSKSEDGKTIELKEQSELCNQVVDKLKMRWAGWLSESPDRSAEIETIYNERVNITVRPKIKAPAGYYPKGMVSTDVLEARKHQLDYTFRSLLSPSTFAVHFAGAGKTLAEIMAMMEQRRIGRINKGLLVVPNHLTVQWAVAVQMSFPEANILAPDKNDFTKHNRELLFGRVATGNWDLVIIGHSQLSYMPVDENIRQMFIKQELDNLREALSEAEAGSTSHKKPTSVKRLEAQIENAKARLDESLARADTEIGLTLQDMGIGGIAVDEAHNFKNLEFATRLQVTGMGNPAGSQKAFNLLVHNSYIRSIGGVVHGLSATPLSNSVSEMYAWLRFYNPTALTDRDIYSFDAFANTFIEIENRLELSMTGDSYRTVSRMVRYKNAQELLDMYLEVADCVTDSDVHKAVLEAGGQWFVPGVKGGAPRTVVVPRSDEQEVIFDELNQRIEVLEDKNTFVDPKDDNKLNVLTDAKKASLHPRLFDPESDEYYSGKMKAVVENTREHFDRMEQTYNRGGLHLIFCDLGVPHGAKDRERALLNQIIEDMDSDNEDVAEKAQKKFNEYSPEERESILSDDVFCFQEELRNMLTVKGGFPAERIASLHDVSNDKERFELYQRCNAGQVDVLLCTTSKGGEGMNVCRYVAGGCDVDAPYKPSQLEQRIRRVVRQGNWFFENHSDFFRDGSSFEVYWDRYVTERSTDAWLYQLLESKAEGLNAIMYGKTDARTIDEVGVNGDDLAATKALATGNDLVKRQHEASMLAKSIGLELSTATSAVNRHARMVADYERSIKSAKSRLERRSFVVDVVDRASDAEKVLVDVVRKGKPTKTHLTAMPTTLTTGEEYPDMKHGGAAIHSAIVSALMNKPAGEQVNIGSIWGQDVVIEHNHPISRFVDVHVVSPDNPDHYISMGVDVHERDPSNFGGLLMSSLGSAARDCRTYASDISYFTGQLEQLRRNPPSPVDPDLKVRLAEAEELAASLHKEIDDAKHRSVSAEEIQETIDRLQGQYGTYADKNYDFMLALDQRKETFQDMLDCISNGMGVPLSRLNKARVESLIALRQLRNELGLTKKAELKRQATAEQSVLIEDGKVVEAHRNSDVAPHKPSVKRTAVQEQASDLSPAELLRARFHDVSDDFYAADPAFQTIAKQAESIDINSARNIDLIIEQLEGVGRNHLSGIDPSEYRATQTTPTSKAQSSSDIPCDVDDSPSPNL